MENRQPTYPGRVKMTPVEGQENIYDMERADEPTVEGTPLNKATLLQDATCALLDLPNTAVPDDAFAKLALGTSMYGYLITVVDGFGHPMEGLTVSGIQSRTGGACVTDENGQALGVSTETSVSVSVTSPYFDLDSASQTVQSTGIITSATLQMAVKYAENQAVTLRTSQTVKFSPAVAEVDFCAVGGGGGAGGPTTYFGGGGGAGGYAVNLLNQTPTPGDTYVFTIGAGGRGGGAIGQNDGGRGGTTTITKGSSAILTANGGNGGEMSARSAAIGNGNGGFAMNTFFGYPTPGTVNLFGDASLGLAGGGGGGSGASVASSPGNPSHSATAGAGPYGASGTNLNSNGTTATGPGGGGGGAGYCPGSGTYHGGEGADGAVILRMRYVS